MIERFGKFSLAMFNIFRDWNKLATEEMHPYGLKGSYALYLMMLSNNGEITSAKLCEMCGKDKADVSRAVAAMEEKGLLLRKGENSYRAKLILTDLGEKVADSLCQRVKLAVEIAGKGLIEEKRQIFYESLDMVSKNLKQLSQDGIPRNDSQ